MEAIKIKNLSFRYPETGVDVIKNISFFVKKGEFVTLCGLSGSGKSTLLRQLKPSIAPHGVLNGEIIIDDTDIKNISRREDCEKIGFVGQSPDNQIVTDKVWHELAFGMESLGYDNQTIRRRTAETASFFGIQHYFEYNVNELSDGQKQLLNLASVMTMQPSILILDEPTSQLDPIAASEFISCLKKINLEFGTTIIISEHRLEEIFPLSDRVIVIENGVLISDDTPENTGKNLIKQNSDCYKSLPASIRIFEAIENEKENPVTIAQAKNRLRNFCEKHETFELYPEIIPAHGKSAVSLKNIYFRYEKNSPDVLKNLSLDIHYGELLTILGGNGTGKSTLLSVINGTNKPYSGKISNSGKLCLTLPQAPQALFTGKTVKEMLLNSFEHSELNADELKKVIALCGLEKLLDRHPFDLSGGEAQKAALAKLLLYKPDILLLDEPTKGLDSKFKETLAHILLSLTKAGTAVVMISHDVEFCAKYSHRCAMMFNGEITAEGTPREFFSSNSFYTTSSARISRDIIENTVTAEDVIYCCTGKREEESIDFEPPHFKDININVEKKTKKPLPVWKRALGISGIVLLIFGILENLGKLPFLLPDKFPLWFNFLLIAAPVVMLMTAFSTFSKRSVDALPQKQKLSKRTIVAAVNILLLIPLTIYIGNVFLYDQKYLFISLLVLLECTAPFFLIFEGRKPQPRELVLIAVLCAVTVAGRTVFMALPQIKPVIAMIIISGAALGGETGFIVGAVTMLVSNIYFGQGAWTPWQMFAAGIIGFISGLLFRKGFLAANRAVLCVYGFIVTIIIYGGIMNFSTVVLSHVPLNLPSVSAFYIQGLPYDIIHAFFTSVFLFFFAEPMLEKLERVKTKYGLIN